MVLAPYNGQMLVPGMGAAQFAAEYDNFGLIYGSPHLLRFVNYAVIDGASRDTGNTGSTEVLRPGLIMAQVTATNKWRPFANGASDGTEIPKGVLFQMGLNTQMGGADTDRFLATIIVGGVLNPEAMCIAATTAYGLDKSTAAHVTVRKAFKYAIQLSDDFMGYAAEALADR